MSTQICICTGQTILIPWVISIATSQGLLSYTIFLLYLTTFLYWGVYNNSVVMRTIDMATALGNIGLITWHNSFWFCCGYRKLWIRSISFSMIVYVLNETINTSHEKGLLVHGIFLHVLPAFTFSYCALASEYWKVFYYC